MREEAGEVVEVVVEGREAKSIACWGGRDLDQEDERARVSPTWLLEQVEKLAKGEFRAGQPSSGTARDR